MIYFFTRVIFFTHVIFVYLREFFLTEAILEADMFRKLKAAREIAATSLREEKFDELRIALLRVS